VAAVAVQADREGWRLLEGNPTDPVVAPAYVLAFWAPLDAMLGWPVTFTSSAILAAVVTGVLALFRDPASGRQGVTSAFFLLLYPVTLLQPLLWIRTSSGATELFYLLALVWAGDTAAYEGGSRTGRRPLARLLSPNKTKEGALWGLAASLLVALLAVVFWPETRSPAWFFTVAVAVWFLAVTGDLFESMLKRAAGRKDSGSLLSAHGGVLDRFDSLMWAGAGLYVLTFWPG